jgi:uncharacterized protein
VSEPARRLFDCLAGFDSVIVAFSGGVDSAYLAWAATQVLGPDRALCVTADSPSYPDHHRQLALSIARDFALRHEIIQTGELERPEYRANPVNRCYYCKHELYLVLTRIAAERAASRRSSTVRTRMTVVITGRGARRRANSASTARSTT